MEGDGITVSASLLTWMIERYRILVGIPLNEHLHGQLIPQSPDEYDDLPEHDYLEALGIERLYAALVNAERSPGHLIHLAHALGRAAKETNILSDSKPNGMSLDPLPRTSFPRPRTPRSSTISADDTLGSVTFIVESDSSVESGNLEDHDQVMSDHASTGNKVVCVTEYDGHASDNMRHASEGPACPDVIDIDEIPNILMEMEVIQSGSADNKNDHSKEVMEGEVKRKREDAPPLSPRMVRPLPLLKATVNLNYMTRKAEDEEGDKKRLKLLNSTSYVSDTADDMHPAGSDICDDLSSTMWSTRRQKLITVVPLSDIDVDTVMQGPEEDTAQNSANEIPFIQVQDDAATINDPGTVNVSAKTQVCSLYNTVCKSV